MVFGKEKLQKILEEKKLKPTEEFIIAVYDGEIMDHLGTRSKSKSLGS